MSSILVLDDNETQVAAVIETLERMEVMDRLRIGFVACYDGAIAVRKMQELAEDLCSLFTDLNVGGLDGLEVIREARLVVPTLPVALISTDTRPANYAQSPTSFYIQKPIDIHYLRMTARQMLELSFGTLS